MKVRLPATSIALIVWWAFCVLSATAVPLGEGASPIKSSSMNPLTLSEAKLNVIGDTLDSIRHATSGVD